MNRPVRIVAFAAICASAAALAEDVRSVIPVDRIDLDLARPRDVVRLDARIARAAAAACGTPSTADLVATNARPGCIRGAIEAARTQRDLAVAQARDGDRRQPTAR